MLRLIIALPVLVAASLPAFADPYRWCAQYSTGGGGENCYFVTLQQCQAAVSGVGGFCRPNGFYTGPDRTTGTARRRDR
jgi:hypothetical protein